MANRLWLPKQFIRDDALKSALEFYVQGAEGQEVLRLWDETKHHIVCPREFLPPAKYPEFKFPFVDLRPEFGTMEVGDLVTLRDETQEKAWAKLSKASNGILNLACGKGKTKLAVKKIAQRKTPTLVIVPDGGILTQWRDSILGSDRSPPGLDISADDIGYIEGEKFEWKGKKVVLALVTTLALRIKKGQIPEEFFRYFGLVEYDEVHRIGAPLFSLTAEPFYGDRLGFTATVQREDGLDPIYRYHIGEPFHCDLRQELVPRIYFWQTPSVYDWESCKRNGITNSGLLRSLAGKTYAGNVYRYWAIHEALKEGRKIICLSHSLHQLHLMHAAFPGSGLIVGETPKHARMGILRSHQLCFAISRLGSEGVDDDRLDTLFWLTPFKSRIALQQSMGRIQRPIEGKLTPVMVVFEDWMVDPMKKMCRELRSRIRQWGFPIEILAPQYFPKSLPQEVQQAYDATFHELLGVADAEV